MSNIERVALKLYQLKCKISVAHHLKLYRELPGLILKLRQQCLNHLFHILRPVMASLGLCARNWHLRWIYVE